VKNRFQSLPFKFNLQRYNMVPFIAFGFVDNTVLIYAGDYIDNTVGVAFGLSSLAAGLCRLNQVDP
jgi:hypothetical protein